MKKRGMSPLIATILLVGIVIVVGTFLALFFKNFSEDQTQTIEYNTQLNQLCGSPTKLVISEMCKNPSNLSMEINNEGSYGIKNVTFMFMHNNGTVNVRNIPSYIGKFGFLKYEPNIGFNIANLSDIIYTKKIEFEFEDKTVEDNCNPVELEIETIPSC